MFSWILAAAVTFWGAVLGGSFYFVRRYVRAIERREGAESELSAFRQRVAVLEARQESADRLLTEKSDPTRHLVAVGFYRHVGNPMISSVAAMLAGEALFFGSRPLAAWLGVFVIVNHVYFVLSEEPGLARRFGASCLEYKATVPRWFPRTTPWTDSR